MFDTNMKNIILFFYCTVSIGLITNVLTLRKEGIFNGRQAGPLQRKYVIGVLAAQGCRDRPKLIGSGALVGSRYALSAAHHFIDQTFFEGFQLKSNTFYVHLGAQNLYKRFGELVLIEMFYVLGYNMTSGENDLVLIKIARPRTAGTLPWEPLYMARDDMLELTTLDGQVASHGMHNTEEDMDRKLRFAVANIFDNNQCDNILPNSSQICIKMYKNDYHRPRGLCKNDGGAPFVVSQPSGLYLVGIASKPKENCDDTERGAIYTDVRRFTSDIVSIVAGNAVASHEFENNAPTSFGCVQC